MSVHRRCKQLTGVSNIQQDTRQMSSEAGVHRNTPTTTEKGDAELMYVSPDLQNLQK
jgi:hypothetical protein